MPNRKGRGWTYHALLVLSGAIGPETAIRNDITSRGCISGTLPGHTAHAEQRMNIAVSIVNMEDRHRPPYSGEDIRNNKLE